MKCKNVANVGFIVDSSGSLRREYDKEKEFVKKLAASFDISEAGSRAGLVTFSYNAELSISMNQYKNVEDFNKAVDRIPLMGYTTRIDKALRLAKQSLMVGARQDAPRIVFLLTDGTQTKDADAVDPSKLAAELRGEGIKLVVIGIGRGIDKDELKKIAGGVDSSLFFADTFDELRSSAFVQDVGRKGCAKGEYQLCFCECSYGMESGMPLVSAASSCLKWHGLPG